MLSSVALYSTHDKAGEPPYCVTLPTPSLHSWLPIGVVTADVHVSFPVLVALHRFASEYVTVWDRLHALHVVGGPIFASILSLLCSPGSYKHVIP